MEPDKTTAYSANFRDLELRTWESNGRYPWTVTNSTTGEKIAQGEAVDRETAMVGAAQHAGADWGTVRWRGLEEEEDDDIVF